VNYHPHNSFLSLEDSVQISFAGTAGYCGAVCTVGGLEIETSQKLMPILRKINNFSISFYIISLIINMFNSKSRPPSP
jgi:hypothetical protein